jgi:serine/threonine protein kinase
MDQLDGPLRVDTSVGGFRVKRLLGEGAMGEVYLAQDLTLGRRVALKVIKRGVMQGDGLSQFLDEARTTASFSHPHIVTIHAFGEHDGRPFLALEYLDGETLRDRIRTAPLSSLAAMRVVRAVADAVAEAHRHDLSRTVGASIGASGTPVHMAPKRWRGTPMTGAADVWALGLPSLCSRFHLESSDWPALQWAAARERVVGHG